MGTTISFDALKFVKKLTGAGIPQLQAEAQAEAFKEAHEENLDSLATKQDFSDVRQEMAKVKAGIKQDLAQFKMDIIKWFFSISLVVSIVQGAAIISALKILHY